MAKIKSFSERLNISLDKLGFPPKHCGRIQLLADMVGLSHRGAGKWVNGQCSPPVSKFPILAKQLQVNEHWLRTGEGLMCRNDATDIQLHDAWGVIQDIPMYNLHQLLQVNRKSYQTMTCLLPYGGSFCGVVLNSEAMSPRFPIGSILILDEQTAPKDGDFVLVHDESYPEPIFRQLLITQELSYLHAYNPKFDRLQLTVASRILGKLVQAIVSFE